ncbi:hypothetical protein Baya_4017 [Bagarius yarrelli]|uniref:Uncharacterized protein n=1 Tax=Bagarius yarrelli TaxID=175774 RepID=A0A556TX74_BAGYA|nr:hypothetical protein Baya_4017 [Bagarius yarrelli]
MSDGEMSAEQYRHTKHHTSSTLDTRSATRFLCAEADCVISRKGSQSHSFLRNIAFRQHRRLRAEGRAPSVRPSGPSPIPAAPIHVKTKGVKALRCALGKRGTAEKSESAQNRAAIYDQNHFFWTPERVGSRTSPLSQSHLYIPAHRDEHANTFHRFLELHVKTELEFPTRCVKAQKGREKRAKISDKPNCYKDVAIY